LEPNILEKNIKNNGFFMKTYGRHEMTRNLRRNTQTTEMKMPDEGYPPSGKQNDKSENTSQTTINSEKTSMKKHITGDYMINSENMSNEKSYIVRKAKKNNYSIISNFPVRNKDLSWKAKGLLWYLLQLPDDFKIYRSHLENQSTDGRDSTYSAMTELKIKGYLVHETIREKGRILEHAWIVHEDPILLNNIDDKKPETENPVVAHVHCEPQTDFPEYGKPAATKDLILPIIKTTNPTLPKPKPSDGLVGGPPKEEIKIYPCVENLQIKQRDKIRLCKQFSQSLVEKAVAYCLADNFKPLKSLDASIFYFCKNPDHMTVSKGDLEKEKQKHKDAEKEKTLYRKKISEKISDFFRKKFPYQKDNPCWFNPVRYFSEYLEICSDRESHKIFYSNSSFSAMLLHYLRKFNYPIPGEIIQELC
jgi:hypothetical protein